MTSTEFEGIIKTGGLGDAIRGISNALSKHDDFNVSVILPNYKNVDDESFERIGKFVFSDSNAEPKYDMNKISGGILYGKIDEVNVYLIDNDYYFNRDEIYGYDDDLMRWAFFSRACCELIKIESLNPDIIHTNDYHEGVLSYIYKNDFKPDCKHVISIHNAYFQGEYQFNDLNSKSLFNYYINGSWSEDDINMLRTGVSNADYVLTVSPDYAQSIKYTDYGEGLQDLYCEKDVTGFINGVDLKFYDRHSDDFQSFLKVKEEYKSDLQKKFNLPVDKNVPLIASVSRLSYQKGMSIVYEAINDIVDNAQFILLGTGIEGYDDKFEALNNKLDNFVAVIDFDSQLADEIYIASDMFLMPSFFEPCGISQMIAQYYASLPIVSDVGGLKDTVIGYDLDNANGFKLKEFSAEALTDSVNVAKDIYYNDKVLWAELMENAYNTDHRWDKYIENYVKFYREAI